MDAYARKRYQESKQALNEWAERQTEVCENCRECYFDNTLNDYICQYDFHTIPRIKRQSCLDFKRKIENEP